MRARAGGWDLPRLRAAIQEELGEGPHPGGRRMAAPADLQGLVLQMTQMLDMWQGRHDQVWADQEHSLTAMVRRLRRKRLGRKTRQTLEDLLSRWQAAVRRAQSVVKELNAILRESE